MCRAVLYRVRFTRAMDYMCECNVNASSLFHAHRVATLSRSVTRTCVSIYISCKHSSSTCNVANIYILHIFHYIGTRSILDRHMDNNHLVQLEWSARPNQSLALFLLQHLHKPPRKSSCRHHLLYHRKFIIHTSNLSSFRCQVYHAKMIRPDQIRSHFP